MHNEATMEKKQTTTITNMHSHAKERARARERKPKMKRKMCTQFTLRKYNGAKRKKNEIKTVKK